MREAERGPIRVGLFLRDHATADLVIEKISKCPNLVIVASAGTAHDALVLLKSTEFDVSVTDAELMEDSARIRTDPRFNPGFEYRRVFLTDRVTPGQIVHGVHTGFDNYLITSDPVDEWLLTIRDTIDGISSLKTHRVWEVAGNPVDLTSLRFEERPRLEKEIVELLSEGLTNDQIAEVLNISCQTVRNKVCRLMDDIGVSNRTLLSLAFRRSPVSWKSEV